MYGSPFGSPRQTQPAPLPRNYSEIFDPAEYECKTDVDLESYARNLSNYLNQLLTQQPFPAFLFDKLEKRLEGITSILKKRSTAKGVCATKQQAEERLKRLTASLDAVSSTQPVSPEEDDLPPSPPYKKRKFESPGYVKEVQRAKDSLTLLQKSYSKDQDEEEED